MDMDFGDFHSLLKTHKSVEIWSFSVKIQRINCKSIESILTEYLEKF